MAGKPLRQTRLIPLYHQVFLHLKDMIADWAAGPDTPLPSEPALARRFGVSRVTIRATLAQLEAEGLVRRVHGVGTFPLPAGAAGPANIVGHLENLISVDDATSVVNLDWSAAAPPDPAAARALGEAPALRIVRVRSHLGRPISFTTITVPAEHAPKVPLPPPGAAPVIRLLEAAGVIAESAEQVLTALAAPALAAEHLAVAPGSPLIAMRRLMRDGARRPILHQESLYVPERYEYRMSLSRTSLGPAAKWTPIG